MIIMEDYEEIISGNVEFLMNNCESIKSLANGQHPKYVVVACSDSREVPELIMNEKLGSIFDIRVAGCVLDESSIGSIEYAVAYLDVKKIILLAHTKCGAVTAAQEMLKNNGNNGSANKPNGNGSTSLDKLVYNIYNKISKNPMNVNDLVSATIDNTQAQLEILKKSNIISEGIKHGLEIKVALYNIDNGAIKFIN